LRVCGRGGRRGGGQQALSLPRVRGVALLPGPLKRIARGRNARQDRLEGGVAAGARRRCVALRRVITAGRQRRRGRPRRHVQRGARADGVAAVDGVQRQPLDARERLAARGVARRVHERDGVRVRQRAHERQLHLARHAPVVQLRQQRGGGGAEGRVPHRCHVQRVADPQRRQHVNAQSAQQRLQKAHRGQHAQLAP
jgi:hypothetical protein